MMYVYTCVHVSLGLCSCCAVLSVFCVRSVWCLQSSRNLLLELSRQLLSGEGDVTRHLGYIGYSVTYQQVLAYVFMQCGSL